MSTSQILGGVGGAVGFYFGGARGAQWGYMLGSLAGSIIDPQRIRGPSIGDGQTQLSQDGAPINIVYGTMVVIGTVCDPGKLTKVIVKEQQGKGGPVVENETFRRTYAILICESAEGTPAEVVGIRRVWQDEKLVYDASVDGDRPEISGSTFVDYVKGRNSMSASFRKIAKFYTGTEAQLPDPSLEAIHGVGQTPAYRGRAYMVVTNQDLTNRGGSIPSFRFEVLTAGVASTVTNGLASTVHNASLFDSGGTESKDAKSDIFPITSDAAILFLANNSALTGAGRIRIIPLYSTPTVYNGPARPEDLAMAGGAIYDSGWYASDGLVAQDFSEYEIDAGRFAPSVSIGAPPSAMLRTSRKVRGLLVLLDLYANGTGGVEIDINWPSLTGGITVRHDDGLPDALVATDGTIYWPAWATPAPTERITQALVPLESIMEDIAGMTGIAPAQMDLTAIEGYTVRGYRLSRQMTGADALRGLQQPFLFDMPEWDGKLRAVRRGGGIVATITDDDLLDTGEDDETRAQQVEIPRALHVAHLDPSANYAATKQTSQRRVTNIASTGEVTVEVALALLPDEAAQLADTLHKITWSGAEGEINLALPDQWSFLTPSDRIEYRSRTYRIEDVEWRDGEYRIHALYDRVSDYSSTANGTNKPTVPQWQAPVGTTYIEVLNIPSLAESDDEPGLYVAAYGTSTAWRGALLQVSADNELSWQDITTVTKTANIGYSTTALIAETGGLPSVQTLTVYLPAAPESVTFETMLRYRNRALLGDEIIQFQTVTDLGSDLYLLSGIIRGAYATTSGTQAANSRFVMLDENVTFVPVLRTLRGQLLKLRAVTSGGSADSAPIYPVMLDTFASQTEFPVSNFTATRDVSDDSVTVSWVGRGRLGPETAPYHSQYFAGYRIEFDDGHTSDLTTSTYRYSGNPGTGVPAGVTVTVSALNTITGAGPASAGITV